MSNKTEKTFLEKQREEAISKEKAAKTKVISILIGAFIFNYVISPIITVYALSVFIYSVDLNWYTYIASAWFHFVITTKVKLK